MIDYKISTKKSFRYTFITINIFSTFIWCVPLKNKIAQTITKEFLNILTSSKRSLLELGNDGGAKLYDSVFQNFLKV